MKNYLCLLIPALLLLPQCKTRTSLDQPPLAPVDPVEDVYFGKTISDPYRYMEDMKSPEVEEWFNTQSEFARDVLDNISRRDYLIEKMKEFDQRKSTTAFNLNITDNDRYFYLKITPEDETGKLFYRDDFEGEEQLLYDPDTFDPESEAKFVISAISPNDDGSLVTIEVAADGSENAVIMIVN
ncbi:MAG: hypothetical protein KAT15_27800, partial [Bacteroidales bacterium]|nr:hypothetical protein [Bacteroidales bacterium]